MLILRSIEFELIWFLNLWISFLKSIFFLQTPNKTLCWSLQRGSEREFEAEEGNYGGWKESAMD